MSIAARTVGLGSLLLVAVLVGCAGGASSDSRTGVSFASSSTSRSWSRLETIATGPGSCCPSVAVDAQGDAIAAWSAVEPPNRSPQYFARAAVRKLDRHWEPVQTLSAHAIYPVIASDAGGDAVAAWQATAKPYAVEAELRRPNGVWMQARPLSVGQGARPAVAMNARGDAVVAWARPGPLRGHRSPTGGVLVAERPADGAFGGAVAVSHAENAFDPTIAINARGDAVVAWEVSGRTSCIVWAAYMRAGKQWSGPHTVSDTTAGCPPGDQVAIGGRGEAIVTWTSQRGPTSHVQVEELTAGGAWGRRRTLASSIDVSAPQLASNAAGDMVAVWSQFKRNDYRIEAAVRSADDVWRMSDLPHATGLEPQAAVDARGDILVAWEDVGSVSAATRLASGRWQPPQTLARRRPVEHGPFVLLDSHSDALVAWQERVSIATVARRSVFR